MHPVQFFPPTCPKILDWQLLRSSLSVDEMLLILPVSCASICSHTGLGCGRHVEAGLVISDQRAELCRACNKHRDGKGSSSSRRAIKQLRQQQNFFCQEEWKGVQTSLDGWTPTIASWIQGRHCLVLIGNV